jgi:hypothetical protein
VTATPDAIEAFLSHRYSSPDINLHVYERISSVVPISFRVDRGVLRTSAVRLQRLIRDADGFVGVYPTPGDRRTSLARDQLRHQSRYFRLELDMAIRSGKPMLVIADRRYGPILPVPPGAASHFFDPQELGATDRPSATRLLRNAINEFSRQVAAQLAERDVPSHQTYEPLRVGVLLDEDRAAGGLLERLAGELESRGFSPHRLAWPPRLDPAYLLALQRCDWTLVDVSSLAGRTLAAFLHGTFIPTLRMIPSTRGNRHAAAGPQRLSVVDDVLYGGAEVGYDADLVQEESDAALLGALGAQVDVISVEPERISERDRAVDYFASAAKRKETVFVSCAGQDSPYAEDVVAELRRRFQRVFYYRDEGALEAGQPWPEQVFSELSGATVGVLLLSEAYANSRNCMDEAAHLYAGYTANKITLVPIRLDRSAVPEFLTQLQYERSWDRTTASMVDDLVRRLAEPGTDRRRQASLD